MEAVQAALLCLTKVEYCVNPIAVVSSVMVVVEDLRRKTLAALDSIAFVENSGWKVVWILPIILQSSPVVILFS